MRRRDARGDASAGWCVSIAITSSLLAAYLPAAGRAELFGDGRAIAAGVWAPSGTARPVDGGVVVSGRWGFCSGITHADMLFAGCMVERCVGAGAVAVVVALRKHDLEILDTWHTLGLRGTGSHDSVANDVFVPATACSPCSTGPSSTGRCTASRSSASSRSPSARPLWAMRAARSTTSSRWPESRSARARRRTIAERGPTQAAVAAGRGVTARCAGAVLRSDRGRLASRTTRRARVGHVAKRLRLAATHAVRTSAEVVRSMYDLAGGTAIYDDSPLQRRFRDAHTATAHFQVNEASRELPGRILLGQPADASTL